jgi:hypothetical protein
MASFPGWVWDPIRSKHYYTSVDFYVYEDGTKIPLTQPSPEGTEPKYEPYTFEHSEERPRLKNKAPTYRPHLDEDGDDEQIRNEEFEDEEVHSEDNSE